MPVSSSYPSDDQFSEAETKRRSEAALKRMLNTPPKPFTPKKKRKPSRAKAATGKARKKA